MNEMQLRFKDLLYVDNWIWHNGPLVDHYEEMRDGVRVDFILWNIGSDNPKSAVDDAWILVEMLPGNARKVILDQLTCHEIFLQGTKMLELIGADPILNPRSVRDITYEELPHKWLPQKGLYMNFIDEFKNKFKEEPEL